MALLSPAEIDRYYICFPLLIVWVKRKRVRTAELNYVSMICSNKFNYTSQIFQFVVSLTLKTATITQDQFWVQFTVLQLKVSKPHERQSFCMIEIQISAQNWGKESGQWWYNFWSSTTGYDALWGFSFQFNSIQFSFIHTIHNKFLKTILFTGHGQENN